MNTKRQLLTIIALAAITTNVSLCQVARAQRTAININKMVFARDPNGQRGLTQFEPTDHVIYCIVGTSNPNADAKYRFVWSYYDQPTRQRTQLFEQELTNQTANEVISKFSSPRDLVKGSYKVEVYIDGRHRQSRDFYVG